MYAAPPFDGGCQTADNNGVPPRITMWVGGGIGTRARPPTNQPTVLPSLLIFLGSFSLLLLPPQPPLVYLSLVARHY